LLIKYTEAGNYIIYTNIETKYILLKEFENIVIHALFREGILFRISFELS